MRWLLAGCCGLALISIAVALGPSLQIKQWPRFYGVATNRSVRFYCQSSKEPASVRWYKTAEYDEPTGEAIVTTDRIMSRDKNQTEGAYLYIQRVRVEDSGVYFCKINDTWGPGTELEVSKLVVLSEALYRTKVKDGLIFLQGLLLAVCAAAVLLRKRALLEKSVDSTYEEPETDHIYEGLAIETCGGGLYEELSMYAKVDDAEAPWE